nr:SDR family NAD(P)-dependent oxidoreductase [Frondihabitans sp. PAMC 28766]
MTTSIHVAPKVAIVTGASGELGRAISRRLAHDGLAVIVHFARNEGPALDLVDQIAGAAGRAVAVGGDVAESATFERLFDAAETHFGGADVLVNNAGLSRLGPLAAASDADYDAVFDASARGTLNGLRAATDRLRDGGRVITLSTTSLAATTPGMGVYMAAKAAVESLTRTGAKELAPRGITVNAIAPGPSPRRCSSTARRTSRWRRSPARILPAVSARPTTSPPLSLCSAATMRPGSAARSSGSTAASPSERSPGSSYWMCRPIRLRSAALERPSAVFA